MLLEGGGVGRAIAPAGASTGTGEALDLRDGGEAFGGYDVTRAVGHVNGEIAARGRRHGRRRPGRARSPADRAGRHAQQVAARRQRAARGVDGGRARRRRGRRRAAVSLSRRAATPARCRCRRSRSSAAARMPAGASTSRTSWSSAPPPTSFAQALDWTAEVYRAAGVLMKEAGTLAGRRRRGRLVARLRHQRAGARDAGPGDRARRLHARQPGRHRARRRRLRVRPRRQVQAGAGGQGAGQRRA